MSDDDCREAVTRLNKLRWKRAENLGDGYDVSVFFVTIFIDAMPTFPTQLLEGLIYTPTIKDILVKYMDGMMSVTLYPCGIFQNLTWQAAIHVQSMMI